MKVEYPTIDDQLRALKRIIGDKIKMNAYDYDHYTEEDGQCDILMMKKFDLKHCQFTKRMRNI